MTPLRITAGPFEFEAVFEEEAAPLTCAWFRDQLPFRSKVIHARWSGEAVWIPLGDLESGLGFENHTVHPSRGDLLFYPGGLSETEILFAYGSASFAAKTGDLAGNHFLTVVSGRDQLIESGTTCCGRALRTSSSRCRLSQSLDPRPARHGTGAGWRGTAPL